ncbi:hypothetical protein ACQEUX_10985 [Micromonospora sp. CA-259024]|uniref:hypothetical protein n=1 Tax=Micromonospora sp. CA-259024 TaxID=3239965 RepID=UPI003D8FC99A
MVDQSQASAPSLFGFDLGRECGSLGLMPSEKLTAVGTPRNLLVCRHLSAVNLGLDIWTGVEECCEQQTHLPAVPSVELDASMVHRQHVSDTFRGAPTGQHERCRVGSSGGCTRKV